MIRLKSLVLIGICVLALSNGVAFGQAPTWTNERSINRLTEHVYRFGANQNAMFVVTPEGIILVDGFCDNMQWLKSELQTRFKVPVKYVVLSHDHNSHICDTQIFGDTAVGIGHVNLKPHLVREKRRSIIPQVMFEHTMEIELGGIRVVLLYLGPTHSDNLIQVHVPSEGVLFAPDFARGLNPLPDYRDLDVHNALKALRTLAYLPDVKIVLEGHDKTTTNQEIGFLAFHRYLQATRDRVLERMVAGKSLEEIHKEVTLADFQAEFKTTPASLKDRIDSMYDYLFRYREPTTGSQPVRTPR